MSKKLISIVTPTYNEIENIDELLARVRLVTDDLDNYEFEIIIIDNCSVDGTRERLKELAKADNRIKVILNARNFGHIRSPYYGILQSRGDATIYLASDLQDPPENIPSFIKWWESGYKLVMASKPVSHESSLINKIRKTYYRALDGISDINLVPDSTGFGLYDKSVINELKKINDPYPFLRGLICELGFDIKVIEFEQPRRLRGISKNNFYSLYDIAMLGIVSHSKLPIRIASFLGFFISLISFATGLFYFFYKLFNWNEIPIGVAPLIIGIFFLFGVLMLFLGIIGEYVASIHSYVQNRPVVIEEERINFD